MLTEHYLFLIFNPMKITLYRDTFAMTLGESEFNYILQELGYNEEMQKTLNEVTIRAEILESS